MRVTSSRAALHTRRGGGERAKKDRDLKMKGYVWGGGRKEGKTNDPEKR